MILAWLRHFKWMKDKLTGNVLNDIIMIILTPKALNFNRKNLGSQRVFSI